MAEPTHISSFINQHSIGVDSCDNCMSKPVISDGQEQLWAVVRRDDQVSLYIGNYEAVPDGDKVVAVPIFSAPPRPPFGWKFQRISDNLPVETYYIVDPSTNRAWTLNSSDPKTQITLSDLDKTNTSHAQWFNVDHS